MASILNEKTDGAEGRGGYRTGREEQNRALRSLSKQTSRQRPCSILPSTSGKISFVGDSADRRESGGGRLQPSLAMHKTNCWHKVTRHAEQGLVGRQEESIPPSLHLSIDIPGSPSSASGFCNYHQTAASRPPKHWLTARINRDVARPWRAVVVSNITLYVQHVSAPGIDVWVSASPLVYQLILSACWCVHFINVWCGCVCVCKWQERHTYGVLH